MSVAAVAAELDFRDTMGQIGNDRIQVEAYMEAEEWFTGEEETDSTSSEEPPLRSVLSPRATRRRIMRRRRRRHGSKCYDARHHESEKFTERPIRLARAHALEVKDARWGDPVAWSCKLLSGMRPPRPEDELDYAMDQRRSEERQRAAHDAHELVSDEVFGVVPTSQKELALPPLTHTARKRRQLRPILQ